MNSLSKYILEKLHLNKDIDIDDDEVVNIIYKTFGKMDIYENNKDEIDDNISKWIKQYKLTREDIHFYTDNEGKELFGKRDNIIFLSYNNFNDMLEKCKLTSYTAAEDKTYHKSFNISVGYLRMMGNEFGFVIWGHDPDKSTRCLLVKID